MILRFIKLPGPKSHPRHSSRCYQATWS